MTNVTISDAIKYFHANPTPTGSSTTGANALTVGLLNTGVAACGGHAAVGINVSRWEQKAVVNYNPGVSASGSNSIIMRAGFSIVFDD